MKHRYVLTLLAAGLVAALPARAHAQGSWQPPSRQMPEMPAMSELRGSWQSSVGPWLGAMSQASGVAAGQVTASGETTPGGARAKFVRFLSGVYPVANWSDRNGDGRADMVEIFHDGARIIQLIDPDYDGSANVMRVYSASGELLREEKL